jgi:hypothetical protein
MKIRKVINHPIRSEGKGINIAGDITGAISANVNESGDNRVVSRQKVHVVQSSKRANKSKPDA